LKEKFISGYVPNEAVNDIFLVSRKEVRPKKTGGDYIFVVLNDRTGSLSAFMWNNVDVYQNSFNVDDFVKVSGVTKEYNRSLQITIHKIERVSQEAVSLFDFIPSTDKDLDEIFAQFMALIKEEVAHPALRLLLFNIFEDEQIQQLFKECPAAKALHHAYIGGLLEHTLSMMILGVSICRHYPFLNKDLLLTGTALHDLGKIFELSWGKSFDYTDQGRLIGHITMISINIDRQIQEIPDFPKDMRIELLHMILSHHGQLEFGSPKRPKTMEALVLSYMDDMDAKVQAFREAAEQPSEREGWTAFNQNFQRFLYRKRYLESCSDREEAPPDSSPEMEENGEDAPRDDGQDQGLV